MDAEAEVVDNVPVFAFLSWFGLSTQHRGSAHRLMPRRKSRSRRADTLIRFIAADSDQAAAREHIHAKAVKLSV